jgi:hypothetical protein
MLDSFIIVGLTMVIVGIIKTAKGLKTPTGKLYVPLIVFVTAAVLNVVNALVFSGEVMPALKDGFILGAAAGGIYSMGKKQMDKYSEKPPG